MAKAEGLALRVLAEQLEHDETPREHALRYSGEMAPTVVRDGKFRLFFFSREELRIHVHVAHPDGEAKFWLTPSVSVATSTGLSSRQLKEAHDMVEKYLSEIQDAWRRHFGS